MKRCPHCAEEIQDAAVKCRFCGERLDEPPKAPTGDAGDSYIPALGEGTLLTGRYRLERRIGKGGMAVVWSALDERLNRRVAVKTIPSIVMEDKRLRRALEDEAKLVMELHHPRIRAIYGLEEDPKAGSYLVMELVEGLSLDDVLAERPSGKLTPDEAAEIGRQICEGVEYAHDKGVIHRDLKPKNLFLTGLTEDAAKSAFRAGQIQIKVMDFGLGVRVRDSVVSRSGFSNTSGTLAYMSPEQLNGEKPSLSMDVYGLGATLHELLMGEAPFSGGDIPGQILRKAAPRVTDAPSWLSGVVTSCLEKEAAKRPASMAEARLRLDPTYRGAAASPPLRPQPAREPAREARPAAPPPVAREFAREVISPPRPQAPARSSGQATQARAAPQPESQGQAPRVDPPTSTPAGSEPAPRSGPGVPVIAAFAAVAIVGVGLWLMSGPSAPRATPQVATQSEGTSAPRQTAASSSGSSTLEWARIPGGTFQMGCTTGDSACRSSENPQHRVSVREFWMSKTEVTVGAFERFANASGRPVPPGQAGRNNPVVSVDWNDARAFCSWAGGRLPSEAEWEYAARGGSEGYRFPWGNEVSRDQASDLLRGPGQWGTSSVSSSAANAFGLYDMAGNVSEWVEDVGCDDYSGTPTDGSAWTIEDHLHCGSRVVRGQFNSIEDLRVSNRFRLAANNRWKSLGFRCARDTFL